MQHTRTRTRIHTHIPCACSCTWAVWILYACGHVPLSQLEAARNTVGRFSSCTYARSENGTNGQGSHRRPWPPCTLFKTHVRSQTGRGFRLIHRPSPPLQRSMRPCATHHGHHVERPLRWALRPPDHAIQPLLHEALQRSDEHGGAAWARHAAGNVSARETRAAALTGPPERA